MVVKGKIYLLISVNSLSPCGMKLRFFKKLDQSVLNELLLIWGISFELDVYGYVYVILFLVVPNIHGQ